MSIEYTKYERFFTAPRLPPAF